MGPCLYVVKLQDFSSVYIWNSGESQSIFLVLSYVVPKAKRDAEESLHLSYAWGFWDWGPSVMHWWPLCSKTSVRRRAWMWSSKHVLFSHACLYSCCVHKWLSLLSSWPLHFFSHGQQILEEKSQQVFLGPISTLGLSVQESSHEIWKAYHAAWSFFRVPTWLPACIWQPSVVPHCLGQSTKNQAST